MNGYIWKSSKARAPRHGHERRRPVGAGYVPAPMTVHRSFWRAHRRSLVLSALGLLASVTLALPAALDVAAAGFTAGLVLYVPMAALLIVTSCGVPVVSWVRHRRMLRVLDARDDEARE